MFTPASGRSHGMSEVLLEYRKHVLSRDGKAYVARACGGAADDGTSHWHGWIEFAPLNGGPVIRTSRETTQPDRALTEMWATGLTPVYLRGALLRALDLARRAAERRLQR